LADQADRIARDMQRMVGGEDQVPDRQCRQDHAADDDADPRGTGEKGILVQDGAHSTLLPFSANRPCGRFWMKMMMTTRMAILASTAPATGSRNLLTSPRPKAAMTVPASWPTPPSTTTMKESTM